MAALAKKKKIGGFGRLPKYHAAPQSTYKFKSKTSATTYKLMGALLRHSRRSSKDGKMVAELTRPTPPSKPSCVRR